MEIVFARTRHAYHSYVDFWRLVELSGFPSCYVDEIEPGASAIYITTPPNGELMSHLPRAREKWGHSQVGKVVLWNLERPDGGKPEYSIPDIVACNDRHLLYADAIWVHDRHFASFDRRYHFVPLGSDARLCVNPLPWSQRTFTYDYCHMSYETFRRAQVYEALRSQGLREGPNSWGELREKVFASTRVMLNVHQTPLSIVESLRFALSAAHKLPVVSETLADAWPLKRNIDYVEAPIESLSTALAAIVTRQDLNTIADKLHHTLCQEWTFRRCVENGVAQSFPEL